MPYNTGNPVPSTDARDFMDNVQNTDVAVNTQELTWTDRLGVTRKTFAGMEAEATEALSRLGYQIIGDYASGLVMQNFGQVFRKDGEFYRAKAELALPYSLTGDWAVDAPKFVSVGDAVLRQELANGTSHLVDSSVVGRAVGTVESALQLIEADIDLQDGEGTAVPVATALVQIMTRDRINAAWYGFKATRTPAEQAAALAAAAAQAKIEGTRLYIPKDDYQLSTGVRIQVPVTMDGGSINFSSGSDFTATGSVGLAFEGGGLTALPALAANATIYADQISFSAPHGLVPGDVICIHNPTDSSWSTWRTYYNAGEFATVRKVDGLTVYLAGLLYDSYTIASVNLYKVNYLKGDFDFGGAEIIGPPLSVNYGVGARFTNIARSAIYGLTGRQANSSQIEIVQSVDVDLYGCNAYLMDDNAISGTQYGLALANTQSLRVHGGTWQSRRHATAMGGGTGPGSIVTRDCHIYDAHLTSRGLGGGEEAGDFHGNVELSSYEGCTIIGGGVFGGNRNTYRNNKIFTGSAGYGFYCGEPKGASFDFINNEVTVTSRGSPPAGRAVFDSNSINAKTVLGGTINIDGLRIMGADIPSAFGVSIRNQGSTVTTLRVAVANLHMDSPNALGPVRVDSPAGAQFASFVAGLITNTGVETLNISSGIASRRKLTLTAM